MSYLRLISQQIERKTEYGEYSLFCSDQGLDSGLSQEGERERPHPLPHPPLQQRDRSLGICVVIDSTCVVMGVLGATHLGLNQLICPFLLFSSSSSSVLPFLIILRHIIDQDVVA